MLTMLNGQKYQMVKTLTKQVNEPIADLGFLEFVTQAFGGSPKLSSSGLAISMTNTIV